MPLPTTRSRRAPARFARLSLLAATVALATGSAAAAPVYDVNFRNGAIDHTGSTPWSGSDTWSSGNSSYQSFGYAIPGRIGMDQGLTTAFATLYSEGGMEESRANERADDFVIMGPAGPTSVPATLHFSAHVHTFLSGGYPSNNADYAQGWFSLSYYDPNAPVSANGTGFSGNYSSYGTGFLSAFTAPGGDFPTSVTANFPVGSPFSVILSLSAATQTYGNSSFAPGICDSHFWVEIGDASGHVMDLPAGYTLDSATWGIVNDQLGYAAAVGTEPPARSGFLGAAPNPTRGATTLTFALARGGAVRARVLDLAGRVVRTLDAGWTAAGTHTLVWDGHDDAGRETAPGVYLVRMELDRGVQTRRVVRLR